MWMTDFKISKNVLKYKHNPRSIRRHIGQQSQMQFQIQRHKKNTSKTRYLASKNQPGVDNTGFPFHITVPVLGSFCYT